MKIKLKKLMILVATMLAGSMSQPALASSSGLEYCADRVMRVPSDFIGFVAQGVYEDSKAPFNFMFDPQLAQENPKLLACRWLGAVPIITVGYLWYKRYYKTLLAVTIGAMAYAGMIYQNNSPQE